MEPLTGRAQHYAWGSTSAIPALLGIPEDGQPWAELWLGAHTSAPARVGDRDLDDLVTASPEIVGQQSVDRFGPRLPYLMKVLAADRALSLQAHPSREQAEQGWAREEAAGIAIDAGHRNYRDDWPKPEVLCALGDFEALYGFADPSVVAGLFARLSVPGLAELVAPLTDPGGADGVRTVFLALCGLPADERALVDRVATAARSQIDAADPAFARFCRTAVELAEQYPGDPGVVAALLMNRVSLTAGQAVFLAAGNLHAYLHGVGVEVMANSDNVLRGGLTPKHVDVDELAAMVDFRPVEPAVFTAHQEAPGVWRYPTPAPEFRVWRIEPGDQQAELPATPYGRIVLVTEGQVTIAGLTLARGESGWLPAGEAASAAGGGVAFLSAPGLD